MEEILELISRPNSEFSLDILSDAVSNYDHLAGKLSRFIPVSNRQARRQIESHRKSHIYAICLYAQFQSSIAFHKVIKLLHCPDDLLHELTLEIGVKMGRILASICGGDTASIMRLIENNRISVYARSAGIKALVVLVANQRMGRGDLIEYIKELFGKKLERQYSDIWDYTVASAIELYPEELFEHLKWVYDNRLVNTKYLGFHWVRGQLEKNKAACLKEFYDNPRNALINNIVFELKQMG